MKYALVIVESASDKSEHDNALALRNIEKAATSGGPTAAEAEVLNPGTFLCDLEYGLGRVCTLLDTAERYAHQTRTLFFDEKPSWVPQPSSD